MLKRNDQIDIEKEEQVKIKILPVHKNDVLVMWGFVREHLKKATDRSHDRMDIDDVLMMALSGNSLLWIVFNEEDPSDIYGAAITRIVQYPRAKVVSGDFCGGNQIHLWIEELEDTFIRYAKHVGATQIEIYGRRGWARMFTSGWTSDIVMMTKRIE